jgi:multicomponent Na+:H+ antiporter subunit C
MRILFWFMLLGSSINLLIFTVGRVTFDAPAFINPGDILGKTLANALPQALILTAIVIGFGLMTFALVLITRVWQVIGTMNSDEMNLAEQQESLEEVES